MSMRLDKYLKAARLIRRRTVAKDAALGNFVLVNGVVKKPSYLVKVDDIITINFKLKAVTIKVTTLEVPKKGQLMYHLVQEVKK
ncbi:MAG: S4 domain-containing protein [Acholeplasmataceae bacterium]|mgnify:CR=1 FL=1|nr:S4 domain-containing protein [Acholeplasmataceae bacterium]